MLKILNFYQKPYFKLKIVGWKKIPKKLKYENEI